MRSCRLLESATDNTAEHVNAHTLALHLAASLILLVGRDTNDISLKIPTTNILDKLLQSLTAAQIKPLLQRLNVDRAESLADLDSDTNANELLETGDVGG